MKKRKQSELVATTKSSTRSKFQIREGLKARGNQKLTSRVLYGNKRKKIKSKNDEITEDEESIEREIEGKESEEERKGKDELKVERKEKRRKERH